MAWTAPRTWVTSETVTSTMMNTHVRDNLGQLWHELAYVEFTSGVLIAAGVLEASPTDIVSAGAITYSGFPILVEFEAPGFTPAGATTGALNLWEDSTDKGRLTASSVTNATVPTLRLSRRYTPASGSKTLKIRGWNTGGNNYTIPAGAGGVGTSMPGYIRVWERGA